MLEWRFMDFGFVDIRDMMAVDEAILKGGEGNTFFFWTPKKSIILGFFQKADVELNLSNCKDYTITRRISGGGIAFSDDRGRQINYGVVGTIDNELFPLDIIESYKQICGVLIDTLIHYGLDAAFRPINDVVVTPYFETPYLNTGTKGTKIHASSLSEVSQLSVISYSHRPHAVAINNHNVRRVRVFGCAALELCYIASGIFDAFIDMRSMLRVTDIAAGKLIVEEAGGRVTDGKGKPLFTPLDVKQRVNVVASNRHVHTKLLELV